MSWCLGKGYIDSNKYSKWRKAHRAHKVEAQDPSYYLYDVRDGSTEFAIVATNSVSTEGQEKAYKILAEFMSEMETYHGKLEEFLNDIEF